VVFNFSGNLKEGVKYFRKLYSKNPLFFSFPDLVTWRWILYYAMALYKFGHVKKASECFARVRKNTRAGFYHRKHIDRVLAEEPPGCLDVPEFIMPWS
jgi:hypothetical protein